MRVLIGNSEGKAEPEKRAFSWFAFDANLSVESLNELAADRQPKTNPSVIAAEGCIHLREGMKEFADVFWGNAYPGVFNLEANQRVVGGRTGESNPETNGAFPGILGGVSEEVAQDLVQHGVFSTDFEIRRDRL
ncbi:MAG: hypothetical protein BWY82_02494 [Verrucomicrobia bacterium ADurb.Bin474]|nr:MAG: hypothetical protein BWY82_02494 [Verrucomicrobia bacterium ADurb.Bin474]